MNPEDLVHALESNNHYKREMALEALGEIKNLDYIDEIVKTLNDKESTVRWRAARTLGNLGDFKGVKPLQDALKDPDEKVKLEAQKSLKRIEIETKNLYENFDRRVLKINTEISKHSLKQGFSYFSPERAFLYVKMYSPYKLFLEVYLGKENFNGIKRQKADPRWGNLLLEKEEQLPEVLEIVTKSYGLIKKVE